MKSMLVDAMRVLIEEGVTISASERASEKLIVRVVESVRTGGPSAKQCMQVARSQFEERVPTTHRDPCSCPTPARGGCATRIVARVPTRVPCGTVRAAVKTLARYGLARATIRYGRSIHVIHCKGSIWALSYLQNRMDCAVLSH
eukprot:COSAG02_NODE_21053_length_804_cov_19.719149_2_plen_144_part_00